MLIDNIIQSANIESQEYRLFLYKINGELIREISNQATNKIYTVQLGAANIIEFYIPKEYDGKKVLAYEEVVSRNLIKVQKGTQDIGFFEIQSAGVETDGIKKQKKVVAYSLEIKFINKHFTVPIVEGGYKLVDNINPDRGILNIICSKSPSWSIGTIDAELLPKVRIFDEADTNIYEFLMNTVQETYECLFEFDTINRKINAKYIANYGRVSPVIISMDNLAQFANISDQADGLVTRLHLYGNNDLSVRDVNLGQDYIDDFRYYKNTRFMSQSLINALNAYEALVTSSKPSYETKLGEYIVLISDRTILDEDLATLTSQKAALEKALGYATSINDSAQIASLQAQLVTKNAEISAKSLQIANKTTQINNKKAEIDVIINSLSMSTNFTVAQLKELDNFIIEDTYQDPNIMTTDSMTYSQVADVQQELLDKGVRTLTRAAVPRYEISIDLIDFFKLKEFAPWWNELFLGDIIWLDVDGDFQTSIRISGYVHDWDNNTLTLTFSDRYSLEDPSVSLMELVEAGASAGVTIDYEKFKYKEYLNEQSTILNFINSSLDLNKNSVIGGTNEEIKMDSSGIQLRRYVPELLQYSPKQIKMTHNAIVLTDDSFDTAKVAIGELINGQYGIAAEVIAGKLIMGNALNIENAAGTLVIDENGITTQSFSLNMLDTSQLQNIILDPATGFKIQTRATTGSAWVDAIKFDTTTKKLTINGTLGAVDGKFSGKLEGGTIGIGGAGYDAFTVDSTGNIRVTKGSININNNFIVDLLGNLTSNTTSNLDGRISSAELKITPTAIVSTVRSSSEYLGDLSSKASTSSITQLSNEISLKVSQGDYTASAILSMINGQSTYKVNADSIQLNGITRVNKELRIGQNGDLGSIRMNSGAYILGTVDYALTLSAQYTYINQGDVYMGSGGYGVYIQGVDGLHLSSSSPLTLDNPSNHNIVAKFA